ncbi:hypothetical protein [Niallia taxi]|uniref:hypothetical protein n=1 Tax=Niallia taxi TaxID=2499688 RepID=UPI0030087643
MIKVDIYMADFSEIHKAILFKGNKIENGSVESEEEAKALLENERVLYFCCEGMQGTLVTSKIMEYFISEDEIKLLDGGY